jgi:hypothetical protein
MKGQNMRIDKMQNSPPPADQCLEQELDRLGEMVAPAASDTEFVSRVMRRIGDATATPRRSYRTRLIARLAIMAAACVIAAIVFWRTGAAHHPPIVSPIVDDRHQVTGPSTAPAADPEPAVRTSTWSTVTESVVLENDVPVRKLLYREFERVELVDAQGNMEGQMVVPTKAMLLASKEQY